MNGKSIFVLLLAGALLAPAWAQERAAPPAEKSGEGNQAPGQSDLQSKGQRRKFGKHQGRRGQGGIGRHDGAWLRRYSNLSPEEQQRALENDQQFQNLPPEAQERLRQRLAQFNQLPAEERQRILERMQRFGHLTPEQQQRARQAYARLRELPPERRQQIVRAFRHLRQMPPEERQRVLDSERFRTMFSDEERTLLRSLAEFGPPADAAPGGPLEDRPPPDPEAPK